ncbi:MAG TPA: sulfurtransferase FdhD [Gammaproteobacteria bacterium]|nr:sulfurtransferase FdhD [Gammaproteobacteria bacterium]
MNPKSELPVLTDTALPPSHPVTAWDEYGEPREFDIAAEQALTVYIDKREVVTLMTLGTHPELLVLGFLKNQGFVQHLSDIKAIQVVWDVNAAAVTTVNGVDGLEEKLGKRTVTTGCGQGTVFGRIMEDVERIKIAPLALQQSGIYSLLRNLSAHNDVYKRAGAVHGCALCEGDEIVFFTEDVGRHNAVDAICGHMWLNHIPGANKVFYTTGRLTSEMVIKVAQMGIPVLLSRSGVTQAGLALAQRIGITMIARAKGRHFLVYHGREHIAMDAVPARSRRPPPDVKRR